jgi:hypothetical protein
MFEFSPLIKERLPLLLQLGARLSREGKAGNLLLKISGFRYGHPGLLKRSRQLLKPGVYLGNACHNLLCAVHAA